MVGLLEHKGVIDDQTMEYARLMMAYTEEFDDVRVLALSRFLYGFALLCHDDLEDSIDAFTEAITTADRLGDKINLVRSLNYMSIAYRRLGEVAKAREYTQKTFDLARALNLVEYLASSHANMAWLAYRDGEVIRHGQMSMEYWDEFF